MLKLKCSTEWIFKHRLRIECDGVLGSQMHRVFGSFFRKKSEFWNLFAILQTTVNGLIAEQLAWLDKVTEETMIQDFVAKKESFDELSLPILNKLNADAGE